MIYKSVSIKEVIGNIVRNTRVQDASYLFAMKEWIPQAMGLMKTKCTLSNKWEDIDIHFHKGKMPCDMKTIKAVEAHGRRIPHGNSVQTLGIPESNQHHSHSRLGTTNGFEYIPQFYSAPDQPNPQENSIIYTQDIVSLSAEHCNNLPRHEHDWYDTELDYIMYSGPDTTIRVHYRAIPVDAIGFPLVPDNENYKLALYYYCRAMMIGAGFEDKIFSYDKLMGPEGYFERHAARAIGEIRYPSTDQMEFKVNEHVRLVKDENYFHNYFSSEHKERKYGFDEYLYNVSPGDAKTYVNAMNHTDNQSNIGEAGW